MLSPKNSILVVTIISLIFTNLSFCTEYETFNFGKVHFGDTKVASLKKILKIDSQKVQIKDLTLESGVDFRARTDGPINFVKLNQNKCEKLSRCEHDSDELYILGCEKSVLIMSATSLQIIQSIGLTEEKEVHYILEIIENIIPFISFIQETGKDPEIILDFLNLTDYKTQQIYKGNVPFYHLYKELIARAIEIFPLGNKDEREILIIMWKWVYDKDLLKKQYSPIYETSFMIIYKGLFKTINLAKAFSSIENFPFLKQITSISYTNASKGSIKNEVDYNNDLKFYVSALVEKNQKHEILIFEIVLCKNFSKVKQIKIIDNLEEDPINFHRGIYLGNNYFLLQNIEEQKISLCKLNDYILENCNSVQNSNSRLQDLTLSDFLNCNTQNCALLYKNLKTQKIEFLQNFIFKQEKISKIDKFYSEANDALISNSFAVFINSNSLIKYGEDREFNIEFKEKEFSPGLSELSTDLATITTKDQKSYKVTLLAQTLPALGRSQISIQNKNFEIYEREWSLLPYHKPNFLGYASQPVLEFEPEFQNLAKSQVLVVNEVNFIFGMNKLPGLFKRAFPLGANLVLIELSILSSRLKEDSHSRWAVSICDEKALSKIIQYCRDLTLLPKLRNYTFEDYKQAREAYVLRFSSIYNKNQQVLVIYDNGLQKSRVVSLNRQGIDFSSYYLIGNTLFLSVKFAGDRLEVLDRVDFSSKGKFKILKKISFKNIIVEKSNLSFRNGQPMLSIFGKRWKTNKEDSEGNEVEGSVEQKIFFENYNLDPEDPTDCISSVEISISELLTDIGTSCFMTSEVFFLDVEGKNLYTYFPEEKISFQTISLPRFGLDTDLKLYCVPGGHAALVSGRSLAHPKKIRFVTFLSKLFVDEQSLLHSVFELEVENLEEVKVLGGKGRIYLKIKKENQIGKIFLINLEGPQILVRTDIEKKKKNYKEKEEKNFIKAELKLGSILDKKSDALPSESITIITKRKSTDTNFKILTLKKPKSKKKSNLPKIEKIKYKIESLVQFHGAIVNLQLLNTVDKNIRLVSQAQFIKEIKADKFRILVIKNSNNKKYVGLLENKFLTWLGIWENDKLQTAIPLNMYCYRMKHYFEIRENTEILVAILICTEDGMSKLSVHYIKFDNDYETKYGFKLNEEVDSKKKNRK